MTTAPLVNVEVMPSVQPPEEDFDYSLISNPDDREWAESAAGFITFGLGQAVVKVLEAGNLLMEAKQRLPHGEYLPWVDKACKLKPQQAQKLIKSAEWANAVHARHLEGVTDTTTLFLLSADATPEDVREWFLERCAEGKPPSRAEVLREKRARSGKPDLTIIDEALKILKFSPESRSIAASAKHLTTREFLDEINADDIPKQLPLLLGHAIYCKNGTGWWRLPITSADQPVKEPEPPSAPQPLDPTVGLMSLDKASQVLGVSVAHLRVRLTPKRVAERGIYVCNGFRVTKEGIGKVRLTRVEPDA